MLRGWFIASISLAAAACSNDASQDIPEKVGASMPGTGGSVEPYTTTRAGSSEVPLPTQNVGRVGGMAGADSAATNGVGGQNVSGTGGGGTAGTSVTSIEAGGIGGTVVSTVVPNATGGTAGTSATSVGTGGIGGKTGSPVVPNATGGAAGCTSAMIDCAGVCNGPGMKMGSACCASGKTDCAGVCDGPGLKIGSACCASGKTDCAGVCDGPGLKIDSACCASGKTDCAGVCDGPALVERQRCCPTGTCPAPLCDDGYLNGAETDIDCGGKCLAACALGATCQSHADCVGVGNCVNGKCVPPPGGSSLDLRTEHIQDIVRDPINGSIYVSVAPVNIVTQPVGGRVAAFAPGATTETWSVPIGAGNPGVLAVSDDGSTLYVSTTLGQVGVAKLDIATRTLEPIFALGTDTSGQQAFARDLAVVPGDASTVAVAIGAFNTTANAGVHFYRNRVEAFPNEALEQWQTNSAISWTDVTALAFKNATTLYAYNGASSQYGLGTVRIQTSGPYLDMLSPKVLLGFDLDVVYAAGKLFASSAQVVDPERHRVLGTFPAMGGMAVAPNGTRVYFVRRDNSDLSAVHFYVDCFDPETYLLTGSISIDPMTQIPLGHTWGKVSVWGRNGLALQFSDMTSNDHLELFPDILSRVRGCLPDATPSPARSAISSPDTTVDGVNLYALDARWLTADPSAGSLYVSVGSGDPRYPNSLVRFSSSGRGDVDLAVPVGSEPGPLAVTDDGTRAWVALEGAAVAVPVDTVSGKTSQPVQLAYDSRYGEMYAQDIEAFPGLNSSFVVTGRSIQSTIRLGMHVYDNGTLRFPWTQFPMTAIAHTDALTFEFVGTNRIVSVNGREQVLLDVGSTGFNAIAFVDSFAKQVQVDVGLALDDRGKVAIATDLSTPGTVPFLGRPLAFDTMELRHFKVSVKGNRFYDVGDISGKVAIQCTDATTRLRSAVIPLPLKSAFVYELEFFGDKGLALRLPGVLAVVPEALTMPGCEP